MTTPATVQECPTSAAERQAILEEYDSYPRGDSRRGAFLRRYGLYSSHIAKWRARLARGDAALESQSPGPKPAPRHPLADETARLSRENARLKAQLTKAEIIIDVEKKSQRSLV